MQITKEYIKTHNFIHTGTEERPVPYTSSRFAPGAKLPPVDFEKMLELKMRINELYLKRDYTPAVLEVKTGISYETFRKYIRKNTKIKITRLMVAKIVVGFEIQLKEADALFLLQGAPLDADNTLLDAIVVNCIDEKEPIEVFYEMCDENGIET